MSNSLEQATEEEFVEKYNLVFESPKKSSEDKKEIINQILDSTDDEEISESEEMSKDIEDSEDSIEDDENTDEENSESLIDEEPSEECTALVTVKERRLMAAQTMFKKSIKISLKSFLISLSLSFLNLFI